MAKTNKKQVMLLIFLIVATLVVLFFMNKDRIKMLQDNSGDLLLQNNSDTISDSDEVSQIKANELRIDIVLKENKKLLQSDEKFLDSLNSYIDLPMTEEEYINFIGTVHNDYPFGNPIGEKEQN